MNQSDTELMKKYVEITPDLNRYKYIINECVQRYSQSPGPISKIDMDITRIVWDATRIESKLTKREEEKIQDLFDIYTTYIKNGEYEKKSMATNIMDFYNNNGRLFGKMGYTKAHMKTPEKIKIEKESKLVLFGGSETDNKKVDDILLSMQKSLKEIMGQQTEQSAALDGFIKGFKEIRLSESEVTPEIRDNIKNLVRIGDKTHKNTLANMSLTQVSFNQLPDWMRLQLGSSLKFFILTMPVMLPFKVLKWAVYTAVTPIIQPLKTIVAGYIAFLIIGNVIYYINVYVPEEQTNYYISVAYNNSMEAIQYVTQTLQPQAIEATNILFGGFVNLVVQSTKTLFASMFSYVNPFSGWGWGSLFG